MRKETKSILSALLGNGLEFYDFTLIGAFTLRFSKIFSAPGASDAQQYAMGALLFGIGFATRPLGALFFGHIGDRLGRRLSLAISILAMGICTAMIGLMPTYATIGMTAPIAIVILRGVQGFCVGGENNGSAVFSIEHTKIYRGFVSALIISGGLVGVIFAYGCSALVSHFDHISWAWRVPFLGSFFISLIGLYIRQKLPEPEEFVQDKKQRQNTGYGKDVMVMQEIWRHHRGPFLGSMGIAALCVVAYYTASTYLHIYIAKYANVSVISALEYACLMALCAAIFCPIMGYISDLTSARRVMLIASAGMCLLAFPFFYLLQTGNMANIIVAGMIIALVVGGFNGPANALMASLFPVSVRYSAVAMGYSLGAAVFGSTALMIYSALISMTENVLAPCLLLGGSAALGFAGVYFPVKASARLNISRGKNSGTFPAHR